MGAVWDLGDQSIPWYLWTKTYCPSCHMSSEARYRLILYGNRCARCEYHKGITVNVEPIGEPFPIGNSDKVMKKVIKMALARLFARVVVLTMLSLGVLGFACPELISSNSNKQVLGGIVLLLLYFPTAAYVAHSAVAGYKKDTK